jgi:hypothetical protein
VEAREVILDCRLLPLEKKMDAQDVLRKINTSLQQIAVEAVSVVNDSGQRWTTIIVSVKWTGDSGICDVVIESSSEGGAKYHFPSLSTYNHIMALWTTSRQLEKPWNELLLTLGSDGSCNTKFAYEDIVSN